MKNAAQVVKEIGEALRDVDEQLRHHPYPAALERGEVSVKALRAFPGTQYHVATSDLRSMAMMVQRFGHTSARGFLNGLLQGEFAALDGLRVLARRLGMTQEELERYEVTPEGFAYATNMAWMAANVSAAEFVVGILVNFPMWGFTCGRMSRALRARYGFTECWRSRGNAEIWTGTLEVCRGSGIPVRGEAQRLDFALLVVAASSASRRR
ncbi:hypothetical protein [Archangium lansingense]|uniref:Thiaminase-2/PQQC domain-containing protein n=1 Tax=Archangium lansingense TaxID=2995310 RepID=A0ABT4A607_9BACT|nr:hypothetical protein [Archangium lansinium]MCY1076699.1 hypothetical protein [Archangium lansinium]